MYKNNNYWSEYDLNLLKDITPKQHISEIIKLFPNRTQKQISWKINQLKLKKHLYRYHSEILLDESFQSCYWLGYLSADGFINKKNTVLYFSVYIQT